MKSNDAFSTVTRQDGDRKQWGDEQNNNNDNNNNTKKQTMRVQIQRLDESTHVCVSKTGQVRQEVDD